MSASTPDGGPPGWWRGGRPTTTFRDEEHGAVHRDVALEGAALARRPEDPVDDLRGLFLDRVVLRGGDVDLTDAQCSVAWSEVEEVHFRQRVRPVLAASGSAAQGSLGARPSVYRGCTFERVRFKNLGGFSLGRGRFEECSFVDCRWEGHFAHDADLVGCTFVGRMNGCVWFGTGSEAFGRRPNEVRDNDFTAVRFTDNVGWRDDFPVARQRFPDTFVPTPDDPS